MDENALELCKTLLDQMAGSVIFLGEDLVVRYINASAEATITITRKHALGLPVHELFPGATILMETINVAQDQHIQIAKRELEIPILHQQKQIRIDCIVTPFVDSATSTNGIIIEFQQVDRKIRIAQEEQMINQQHVMKTLMRGFAHEVKNPLGGVRGAAQLLESELHSEDLKEYTQVIIREADRLQKLVDQMLGPNRIGTKQALNIHEVLEYVRQLVLSNHENANVTIRRDYDPSIPFIDGNKDHLIQALLNIVQNAVEATEHQGEIILRTRTISHFTIGKTRHRLVAKIEIIDNGPGIPEELSKQIFYPMVTSKAQGTGLGLAITQTLIGQHDGLVQCASEPGKTVFTILIPIYYHNTKA